jgi:hypothetical protein
MWSLDAGAKDRLSPAPNAKWTLLESFDSALACQNQKKSRWSTTGRRGASTECRSQQLQFLRRR